MLDPPYQPGERELTHDHFAWSRFRYADHERLAKAPAGEAATFKLPGHSTRCGAP